MLIRIESKAQRRDWGIYSHWLSAMGQCITIYGNVSKHTANRCQILKQSYLCPEIIYFAQKNEKRLAVKKECTECNPYRFLHHEGLLSQATLQRCLEKVMLKPNCTVLIGRSIEDTGGTVLCPSTNRDLLNPLIKRT